MKGLFRYLDRRLLVAIAVVIVTVFVARATWISSSQSSLADAQTEKTAAEGDLNSFRTRLVEIRSEGVSTGDALLQRVARLEVLVPAQNDVLTISSNFIAIAESSGVVLESFAPVDAGKGSKEETAARVLRGTRYSFTTSGGYGALATFIENIIASSRFVATIDSLSLSATGADTGMFGESVRVSGDVLVWSLIDKPLTNPVVSPSPIGGGSAATTPTTLPGDPSSVTTLPGDPSSVTTLPGTPATPTTLPAAPTTLPAGNAGTSGLDPRFGSCDEAIAEGFGPYVDGDDPEYDFYADEDADGEGVVCAG
jgi:Tfp pilus assembly protein PilO